MRGDIDLKTFPFAFSSVHRESKNPAAVVPLVSRFILCQ